MKKVLKMSFILTLVLGVIFNINFAYAEIHDELQKQQYNMCNYSGFDYDSNYFIYVDYDESTQETQIVRKQVLDGEESVILEGKSYGYCIGIKDNNIYFTEYNNDKIILKRCSMNGENIKELWSIDYEEDRRMYFIFDEDKICVNVNKYNYFYDEEKKESKTWYDVEVWTMNLDGKNPKQIEKTKCSNDSMYSYNRNLYYVSEKKLNSIDLNDYTKKVYDINLEYSDLITVSGDYLYFLEGEGDDGDWDSLIPIKRINLTNMNMDILGYIDPSELWGAIHQALIYKDRVFFSIGTGGGNGLDWWNENDIGETMDNDGRFITSLYFYNDFIISKCGDYEMGIEYEYMPIYNLKSNSETQINHEVNSTTTKQISVYLNNQKMVFDQNPIIENGRTLVPLRSIFEGLGAEVQWNAEIQEVIGTTLDKEVILRIGDTSASVNGEQVTLDVPAKIENGRTLVPLRFISESLDAEVKWNEEEYRIDIVTKEQSLPEIREIIEENDAKYYLCKNGEVYVEGWNSVGQLGLGHKNEVTKPTKVYALNGVKIKDIISTCGMGYSTVITYFISEDNNIYACGYNGAGELGLGHNDEVLIPTRIKELDGKEIKEIEKLYRCSDTYYLTKAGEVYYAGYGQEVNKITKVKDLDGTKIIDVIHDGEGNAKCFLSDIGEVFVSGGNRSGALGLGHMEVVTNPTKIQALNGIKIIDVIIDGNEVNTSIYYIAQNRDVYASGSNEKGQLGIDIQYNIKGEDEYISSIIVPQKVINLEGIEVKTINEGIITTVDDKKIIIKKNIKNFISENPDSEEYFVYEDKGESYGYEDRLWDGCSTWCSVEEFNVIAKASSTLASQGVYSYSPSNIKNKDRNNAWVEGVEGDGVGEYIEIVQSCLIQGEEYKTEIKFEELCIVNGYAATERNWIENNRVKELKMYFADEYIASIILVDTIKPQYIDISSFDLKVDNGEEAKFKFEIASVYDGEKYSDTCLTGIEIEFSSRTGH